MGKLPKNAEPYKFKPGQSGNPSGRPPNPIPNALKKLTVQSYRRIIKAIVKGNLDFLRKVAKDPKSSALEVSIAACYLKAIERGDYSTVEHMLQRIVGKIPDKLIIDASSKNVNLDAKDVGPDVVKEILKKIQEEV